MVRSLPAPRESQIDAGDQEPRQPRHVRPTTQTERHVAAEAPTHDGLDVVLDRYGTIEHIGKDDDERLDEIEQRRSAARGEVVRVVRQRKPSRCADELKPGDEVVVEIVGVTRRRQVHADHDEVVSRGLRLRDRVTRAHGEHRRRSAQRRRDQHQQVVLREVAGRDVHRSVRRIVFARHRDPPKRIPLGHLCRFQCGRIAALAGTQKVRNAVRAIERGATAVLNVRPTERLTERLTRKRLAKCRKRTAARYAEIRKGIPQHGIAGGEPGCGQTQAIQRLRGCCGRALFSCRATARPAFETGRPTRLLRMTPPQVTRRRR